MRMPRQRPARAARSERSRVLAALAGLPVPADPAFPQAVRAALEGISDPEPVLRQIVEDRAVRRQPRFAALYALLLRLRREERYGEYGTLVRRFEGEFGTEPFFHTFRAILARVRGDLSSLRSAVEYSRQAVELMCRPP